MPQLTVVAAQPSSTWRQLVTDYLLDRRASGITSRTIAIYEDALRNVLLPFLAEHEVEEPSDLKPRHLNQLASELLDGSRSRSGKPLSKSTVSVYLRATNTFLAYVQDQGVGNQPRAKVPRQRRRVLDVLSRDEMQAMEDAATSERDKVIVRLFADTGIRLGELVALRVSDLQQAGGKSMLRVGEKPPGQRLVPLSPALNRRLRTLANWSEKRGGEGHIFMSLRRDPGTGRYEPLTPSGVTQLIHHLAKDAGITKRVHPHLFRHSFATDFLRRGGNPLLLQQILGHTTLAMISQTYSHLTIDDAHSELMRVLVSRRETRP